MLELQRLMYIYIYITNILTLSFSVSASEGAAIVLRSFGCTIDG